MATLGKSGLRQVAELCFHKSHYAGQLLAKIDGCRVHPQAPGAEYFKELVVELPCCVEGVNRILRTEHGMIGGYDLGQFAPDLANHMLVAVTELCTRSDIERFVEALEQALPRVAAAGECR